MTHSNKYKPFMAYIPAKDHEKLLKLSLKTRVSMTQLVREGIAARLIEGNPYNQGFNDGLTKAAQSVNDLKASEMRFPSGKSFGELASDAIMSGWMVEGKNESSKGSA